jgi:hypothetical protein
MSNGAGIGLCIVLFDTEHGEAAVSGLTPPDRPEVISCEVYDVEIGIEGTLRPLAGRRPRGAGLFTCQVVVEPANPS